MNVVIWAQRSGPGSGTPGVTHRLAEGLVARGHHVHLRCRRASSAPSGVQMLPWASPHRTPRSEHELRVTLDRIPGCDVVRASGGVHRMWSRVASRTPGRWMGAHRPRAVLEGYREAMSLVGAAFVVCNSLRAAGEVQAWHRLPADQVRVVRNGVDLDRFTPDPAARAAARGFWRAEGLVALFLGHGWYRKGLDAAVEAFRLVSDRRDRLVVMGSDGQREGRLARARARLGEQLIEMRAQDPGPWLPGADVLVHPTRYDASANAVLEAMACGVPPVTTLRDGAAEIVDDRRLVVGDPTDVQGIARAVRYAWDAPGMRERCRRVAESWPTSRMVAGVETILKELRHG